MHVLSVLSVLMFVLTLAVGCGDGKRSSTTGPTTSAEHARSGGSVTAELRDRFLSDHNARFNGGRTFRWVPPIPIFILTSDSNLNREIQDQFSAWENALGSAASRPFYAPQPLATSLPARGIFIAVADLPDPFAGVGDPISPLELSPRGGPSAIGGRLRQLDLRATRRLEIPEIGAGNQITRCQLTLDQGFLETASDRAVRSVIRHEVGHCLGFLGHVSSGLMRPTCCELNITSDVTGMMRTLYRLAPGTTVTR